MRLKVENIGKIKKADIEIAGITIIAGHNNTGKSTISKSLYCVMDTFYKAPEQLKNVKIDFIRGHLQNFFFMNVGAIFNTGHSDFLQLSQLLFKCTSVEEVKNTIISFFPSDVVKVNGAFIKFVNAVYEVVKSSDIVMLNTTLELSLKGMFNSQITNTINNSSGQIELKINEHDMKVFVSADNKVKVENPISFMTEILYIDTPYSMDGAILAGNTGKPHWFRLNTILHGDKSLNVVEKSIYDIDLSKTTNKLNEAIKGKLERKMGYFYYRENVNGKDIELRVSSLSTGLKTFATIKRLLENGYLEKNGVLILDEPEIHLHPDWQLIFAELIVIMQKELDLHILINSHSPYFIKAIDTYSKKYNTHDKCNYYLTDLEEEGVISKVTDEIDKIFDLLAKPFKIFREEEAEYDKRSEH